MNIEPLESRIAPAAVFTYTDVDGDWIASSLESGCTSSDGIIGDNNDAVIAGGTMSKIASIVIKGQVVGEPGTTHTFGIFAQTIGAFKYHGITVPLTAGASNDTFASGDAGIAHPSARASRPRTPTTSPCLSSKSPDLATPAK